MTANRRILLNIVWRSDLRDTHMKMMNVYLVIGVASAAAVLPYLLADIEEHWSAVLAAIGESALAAVLFAVLVEIVQRRIHRHKRERTKAVFFEKMRNEVMRVLGRIMWFSECLGESNFNWTLQESEYWTLDGLIWLDQQHGKSHLSYQEGLSRLEFLRQRFSVDAIKGLPDPEKEKIIKMFRIIAVGSTDMIKLASAIGDQRLTLAIEEMMSLEDTENMVWKANSAVGFMINKRETPKNYGLCITWLLDLLKTVEDENVRKNGFSVEVCGGVSPAEL